MKPLRIGITLGLRESQESLWLNGIKQNALFLCDVLRACETVECVQLVNMTGIDTSAVAWDRARWPVASFDDVKDSLDILIELGGQIDRDRTAYLKQRGTRLVSYCCGVEYVNVMQWVLFPRTPGGGELFVNDRYDAVWVIPQVAPTSEHFFRAFRRCETTVVPFVWSPALLREASASLPGGGQYHPRQGAARVSVIEPNSDVVKFCLYPILIVEETFRAAPESISFLHVTNAKHLAEGSAEFVSLMNQLDLVRAGKASFVGRYPTPGFLSMHTDVVVSHQWGNPLNYLYLEVCWQGFPLVHNASLCADLGYYYADNDVRGGAAQLTRALRSHDGEWQAYRDRQRSAIARYLTDNLQVIREYRRHLERVMNTPLR